MAGEVAQRSPPLLEPAFGVSPAKQRVRARLVQVRVEAEGSGRPFRFAGLCERLARDDAGERGHVPLAVAARHAERVQFEDFPRQILVEAAAAPEAGARIGSD